MRATQLSDGRRVSVAALTRRLAGCLVQRVDVNTVRRPTGFTAAAYVRADVREPATVTPDLEIVTGRAAVAKLIDLGGRFALVRVASWRDVECCVVPERWYTPPGTKHTEGARRSD